MKKYTYLVNFDSQTLERVGESFAVKGDGGIAELEFVIPSNFGIPANQALWRVFFKLPGERESLFETLPTVTQTESGDYVTAWVISKAITQKAGRLAFSLAAISGENVQWNSRTVSLQVPESQYQPESEEAEEPYTGRLTALEGDMAAIRGEFAEVQEAANGLDVRVTANTDLSESNEQKVYKFRTDEGANTGTGSAGASSSINWGFHLNIDENIEKCYSITFTPSFPSTVTGEYTATRWKKASGTLVTGDVLTKIAEITKSVGESVTFEKVGTNEFISLNKSCYRSTGDSSAVGYVKMGHIDPTTGVFTSFSGELSGAFSVTFYKAIKDDSMSLYGKKIALIGDSITEHNGRANTNHGMWLEQWTGCDVQNLGVDSAGFSTDKKYKDRIASIKAGTEIIGVAASLNDLINPVGEASDGVEWRTVCGYANEFFDLLLASFPSVPIVCYSEGPWEPWRPGVGKSDTYMEQMKQICLNKGIAWDDGLYRGCALRPWIQANREALYKGESGSYVDVVDNIHPNSEGQRYIAIYLGRLFEKFVR